MARKGWGGFGKGGMGRTLGSRIRDGRLGALMCVYCPDTEF